MNIILKSFDGPLHRIIAQEALRGRTIGTCINIINDEKYLPNIDAENMVCIPATPLREGRYDHVNWGEVKPLDEELIEQMRHCEMSFLSMIERYGLHGDIPYEERKHQYLDHLRFWNNALESKKIDLCVMNHAPHQAYDLVIYHLCKLKGVPIYHLERCYSVEGILAVEDFKKSDEKLLETFDRLKGEYRDESKPIPLSESYEQCYKTETAEEDTQPWFAVDREDHLKKKGFIAKWLGKSLDLFRHKPLQFIRSVLSPTVWSRKLAQHRTTLFYDTLTNNPDLSASYIYVPLQMQPEEGVSPRAGAFENQELIIQLLAAHIPSGVCLYVKEHPNQGEMFRSEDFYRSIASIPSVTLVPRAFDTFQLMRNSKAVATATGTAGFEALFRGKPFLMFGHRWCQYAPGVYRIRTAEDCQKAMQSIFEKGETPSLRDLRLYLKAIEQCSVPFEGGDPVKQKKSPEERARGVGAMLHERLEPLFV